MKNFTVYRSSAGSGKTYTLAVNYLALAISKSLIKRDYYKKILAITFTNKAAQEMKERVLYYLNFLSQGKDIDNILSEIISKTEVESQDIFKISKNIYSHILHNYSDLSIQTIDKFSYKIVKTFSSDLGMNRDFELELDSNKIIQPVIALLLNKVSDNNSLLTDVLVNFTIQKLEDGNSNDIQSDLEDFCKHLFIEGSDKILINNSLTTVEVNKLKNNQSKLAVLLEGKNANMIVDDLIVSFINYHKYRLVVNTNTIDFFREKTCLKEQDKTILAIQGDYSQKLLEEITNRDLSSLYFMENKPIYKNELEICRCGYTGEDGFELYITGKDSKLSNDIIESLVDKSLNNKNIMFGGLIERDILRQEAGLWLAGNEFSRSYPIQFDGLNSKYLTDIKYRNNEHFYCESRLKYFCSDKPIKNVPIYAIIISVIFLYFEWRVPGYLENTTNMMGGQAYAAVVYLSPADDLSKGTGLFRSKETGKIVKT